MSLGAFLFVFVCVRESMCVHTKPRDSHLVQTCCRARIRDSIIQVLEVQSGIATLRSLHQKIKTYVLVPVCSVWFYPGSHLLRPKFFNSFIIESDLHCPLLNTFRSWSIPSFLAVISQLQINWSVSLTVTKKILKSVIKEQRAHIIKVLRCIYQCSLFCYIFLTSFILGISGYILKVTRCLLIKNLQNKPSSYFLHVID